MRKTIIAKALLYICLLVGAVFFVQQSFFEFMEGSSSYSVSHEPMTQRDLPTGTVCFSWQPRMADELAYGHNFSIDVRVSENGKENTVTLKENKGVNTIFELTILLKSMKLSKSKPGAQTSEMLKCYKITFTWNGQGLIHIPTDFQIDSKSNGLYGLVITNYVLLISLICS